MISASSVGQEDLAVLSLSDRPVEQVIAHLARLGIQAGYLVPTQTGLDKSILDAHSELRDYLRLTKFHDYSNQPQGPEGKIVRSASVITRAGEVQGLVSLYRPETKSGDPRIWLSRLKDYADPGNLLVLLVFEDRLFVVNVSDRTLLTEDGIAQGAFNAFLIRFRNAALLPAQELLGKLRDVAQRGWVSSLRVGPTGVGYTLETLLGIRANSSRAPDYKGIEIKSGRISAEGKASTRTTLFSKTPDWKKSQVKRGLELLDKYGYRDEQGRLQLYCSLGHRPNSLGHYLEVGSDDHCLFSMHKALGSEDPPTQVFQWDIEVLRKALNDKHRETFWVKADTQTSSDGQEQFRYRRVIHTKAPLLANFVPMFRLGRVELDYVLHEVMKNGRRQSRDHGYLFKMWSDHIQELFPPPSAYELV